jgi:hypothetical protein
MKRPAARCCHRFATIRIEQHARYLLASLVELRRLFVPHLRAGVLFLGTPSRYMEVARTGNDGAASSAGGAVVAGVWISPTHLLGDARQTGTWGKHRPRPRFAELNVGYR